MCLYSLCFVLSRLQYQLFGVHYLQKQELQNITVKFVSSRLQHISPFVR